MNHVDVWVKDVPGGGTSRWKGQEGTLKGLLGETELELS